MILIADILLPDMLPFIYLKVCCFLKLLKICDLFLEFLYMYLKIRNLHRQQFLFLFLSFALYDLCSLTYKDKQFNL